MSCTFSGATKTISKIPIKRGMEKDNANGTKARRAVSSQKSSPLRLAVAGVSGPNEDEDVPRRFTPRVDRSSKLDSKKQKLDKKIEKACNNSISVGKSVPIGAVSVTTRSQNLEAEYTNEEGAGASYREINALGHGASYEHTVEAHVVEESSEEKEKYEQETRERLLAELTGQAAQAVVVITEEKEPEGGSFLLRGCLCFLLVLIVAITTGVVLSSKTSSKSAVLASKTSSEGASGSPIPPSSPTDQPSLTPTFEPKNNTFCDEAHQLVVGKNISGSLEDSIGSVVVFCEYSSIASYATWGSPERWYVYRGEGFPVFAKTDPFVDIHLYLDCDVSCHYDAFYPNWESESTVLWEAETGTDYYILVSGPEGMDQDSKTDFTLTFQTNDSLETAYGPLTPGRNSVVGGSTVGTKVASDMTACGSASAPTAPGVWYTVTGNGRTITASTCGSPTGFDTQISVFTAETSLCVDGNDDFCSSKSQVAWSSTEDEIYYILVHGKDGAEGTFILQITTDGTSLADADFCANAESVEVGFSGPVDLSLATADPDLLNCTGAYWVVGPTVVGNFYTFTGTGEQVLVSLDYPTIVYNLVSPPSATLLTGSSCNALECIAPCQDDTVSYSSQLCTVRTVLDQQYYIYVYYIEEAYFEDDFDLNGGVNLTIQVSDL